MTSQICRFTGWFCAPTDTNDADTIALYHFAKGQGNVHNDSSGHDHHGQIVAAKWVKLAPESPAVTTTTDVGGSTKREFASDEWIDVLPLIDPALDKTANVRTPIGKNDWRLEQGELRYYGDDKAGKLLFPVRYRGRSLEWEFEFTRTKGAVGFNTDIPVPGGFVQIVIGNDKIGFVNELLSDQFRLVNDRRTKLRFRVTQNGTNDRFEVFANDAPLADRSGQLDTLKTVASGNSERNPAEHNGFFAGGPSNFTFHAIRVRMLNGGTAELLRPRTMP